MERVLTFFRFDLIKFVLDCFVDRLGLGAGSENNYIFTKLHFIPTIISILSIRNYGSLMVKVHSTIFVSWQQLNGKNHLKKDH